MSEILTVAGAIASMTVTIPSTSQAVTADALDSTRNSLASADLPHRVILPWTGRAGQDEFGFIAYGNPGHLTYKLCDLLLYRPVGQGRGLADILSVILDYMGAYAEKARTIRGLGGSSSVLEGITLLPGVYEYPSGSGQQYDGVAAVYTINEYLTS